MKTVSRFPLVLAVVLAFALAACSSDDNPTGGGGSTDTTPPTVTTVTPVDAYHVDVAFDEQVTKASAENTGNYTLALAAVPAPPQETAAAGATVAIASAVLGTNDTVRLTTASSMAGLYLGLSVVNVSDTHGNAIKTPVVKSFAGSNDPDTTPPHIVSRTPVPGSNNVAIGTTVVVQFDEPINYGTFASGFSWSSFGGPVGISDIQYDGTTFTVVPSNVLANGTQYMVSLTGVQDIIGNTMTDTEWSFTTTNTVDNEPPTLVSTSPANNATNVDVNANLSLTFSEAISQSNIEIVIYPDPGDGVPTWSNGGKTVTFDPYAPLLDNQQYVITMLPNSVFDLSGNGIQGLNVRVFSTGSSLESGSIAGTIQGHSGTGADDPTGAFVVAGDGAPFAGDFNFLGVTLVAGNDTYALQHLYDGTYYIISALDTNHNGRIEPDDGDAFGAYGIDIANLDFTPDSVVISGGNHATNINFPLYDPSAVQGTVSYDGIYAGDFYPILAGLYETSGFDPANAAIATGYAYWPYEPGYSINSLDAFIPSGDYYVGAFMDLNGNEIWDSGSEPIGFYGGLPTPTMIHIANGNDISGADILLADPVVTLRSVTAQRWPTPKRNEKIRHLYDLVRQAQEQASR